MSKFFKKLFGALADKPWDKEQMIVDNIHQGKTFNISNQTSAVIVIFGVSTTLFTLVVTGYLYSIPAGQETDYLLKPNLLWINTSILLFVTYFFNRITKDLKNNNPEKFTYCWFLKLLIFIWTNIFLDTINEKWKLCFYK